MSQFTDFNAVEQSEINSRMLKTDLKHIRLALKRGDISFAASKILISAAHKAQSIRVADLTKDTKTYIRMVNNDFIKTFGAMLSNQHKNSAVTTNKNIKGRAPENNAKPRFSPNGLEVISQTVNGKSTGKEIYKLNKTVMHVVNSLKITSDKVGS